MTAGHGGRGLLVAAVADVAGNTGTDHSIAVAVISAVGGVVALIIGPTVADWLRSRRKKPIDHHDELAKEQAELAEHFIEELTAARVEIAYLRKENGKLRQKRGGP